MTPKDVTYQFTITQKVSTHRTRSLSWGSPKDERWHAATDTREHPLWCLQSCACDWVLHNQCPNQRSVHSIFCNHSMFCNYASDLTWTEARSENSNFCYSSFIPAYRYARIHTDRFCSRTDITRYKSQPLISFLLSLGLSTSVLAPKSTCSLQKQCSIITCKYSQA